MRKRKDKSSHKGTPGRSARRRPADIGPVMADIAGTTLTAEDRELLSDPRVGGVILFSRNFTDKDQLLALCGELRALKRPRLLLAVDHEGGRVQRFREGFTRVPPMRTLGRRYQADRRGALAEARRWGQVIGRELGACGIDLCFAPVLDRDTGVSEVIGDRAFSGDVDAIAELALAFTRGLAAAGLAATGKHFPGHGAVVADSHRELPVDPRPWAEIAATELAPFRVLARRMPSLMLAHVHYPAVDPLPASLSPHWIRAVLRRRLKYDGALFCDDLSMGGAAGVGDMAERARLALGAGCDMVLVCNDREGLKQVLSKLRVARSANRTRRLRRLFQRRRKHW